MLFYMLSLFLRKAFTNHQHPLLQGTGYTQNILHKRMGCMTSFALLGSPVSLECERSKAREQQGARRFLRRRAIQPGSVSATRSRSRRSNNLVGQKKGWMCHVFFSMFFSGFHLPVIELGEISESTGEDSTDLGR